jgi:hypothetical protein
MDNIRVKATRATVLILLIVEIFFFLLIFPSVGLWGIYMSELDGLVSIILPIPFHLLFAAALTTPVVLFFGSLISLYGLFRLKRISGPRENNFFVVSCLLLNIFFFAASITWSLEFFKG